jgi:5-aminolevulinate synthase
MPLTPIRDPLDILLGLKPKDAIIRMVNDENGTNFPFYAFDISAPVLVGRFEVKDTHKFAASANLIDFVRSFASGFIFSTALPPAVAAGAAASIRHLKDSSAERELQQERVAQVRRKLDLMGIPHLDNPSHIIPVMVGDAKKCKMISDWLMDNHGIYVQPINYPTVPVGTERLRVTPSPVHTDGDIDRLIKALSEIWSHCELARMEQAA